MLYEKVINLKFMDKHFLNSYFLGMFAGAAAGIGYVTVSLISPNACRDVKNKKNSQYGRAQNIVKNRGRCTRLKFLTFKVNTLFKGEGRGEVKMLNFT